MTSLALQDIKIRQLVNFSNDFDSRFFNSANVIYDITMTAGSSQPSNNIAKLDYPQPHEQTSLLHSQYGNDDDESQPPSPAVSATNGPFFEAVANGIRDRDRQQFKREVIRYISFAWAVICTYVFCDTFPTLEPAGRCHDHFVPSFFHLTRPDKFRILIRN